MPSFLYCEVFFDKKWKKYQQKSYYSSTNIPYLPRKNNRHPFINIISYKKKICFPSSKYQKKLEKGNHSIQDKNKHFFSLSHLIFVGKRCQVPPTECQIIEFPVNNSPDKCSYSRCGQFQPPQLHPIDRIIPDIGSVCFNEGRA